MVKGLNHVGLSVSNLDRSLQFYRNALGLEEKSRSTFEPGKFAGRYERILRLPGATGRVATTAIGTLKLELFEFSNPPPKPRDPNYPVNDHGISHFCVEVTDIEAVYRQVEAAGATFHCPPLEFGKAKALYARDPDGNVFELLESIP